MSHPYENKLFAFVGEPIRCSRREAREALDAVGGVTDERISTFTEYVVEFNHNGKSKKYARAVDDDKKGYLILLNEVQFFEILEGKVEPPRKVKCDRPSNTYTSDKAHIEEKDWNDILTQKRINNMAKYGVAMPDGSIAKIDLKQFDENRRIFEYMRKLPNQRGSDIVGNPHDKCDECGNPAKVHIDNNKGNEIGNLCEDCYNRIMAELTGTVMTDISLKHILVMDDNGYNHEFDLEFLVFDNGKQLTATAQGMLKHKAEVYGEHDTDFHAMLESLERKLKYLLSTKHIDDRGFILDGTAVGFVQYNHIRDSYDIYIDGKPYTWKKLEKNIAAHEGWTIKIEFGDFDDIVD